MSTPVLMKVIQRRLVNSRILENRVEVVQVDSVKSLALSSSLLSQQICGAFERARAIKRISEILMNEKIQHTSSKSSNLS